MTQELELMRTIISMSTAIENVTNALKSAEASLTNGEAELIDLMNYVLLYSIYVSLYVHKIQQTNFQKLNICNP